MATPDIEVLDNRVKWGLLLISTATLVLLVMAALTENVFPEWRSLRKEYAALLKEKANDARSEDIAALFEIGIDQNVMPELGTIDRCITCHVGLEDPRMAEEAQPFRTHPGKLMEQHPPEKFGCTICHQGQGRATETNDAHGYAPYWEHPMLDSQYLYASCPQCHDGAALYGEDSLFARSTREGEVPASAERLAEGKRYVEDTGCLGCHKLDGTGGILGPDITFVGDKTALEFDFSHFGKDEPHTAAHWLKKHFLEPAEISPDTLMPDLDLTEEQADILTGYVLSLKEREFPASYRPAKPVGAPQPEPPTGAELYGMFCSSCHGSSGEASEVPGIRTPSLSNRDTLAVAGDDYYRLIIAHGRSGTNMPPWGPESGNLSYGQIDQIVAHMRGWESTGADVADISARRGDAEMGRVYYRGLCGNCHGRDGEGGIGNALNSPTFLSIASDQFLGETIVHGRPGTAMASWKHLSAQAVSDIVAHLRTWQRTPATYDEVREAMWSMPYFESVETGATLYEGNCAGCHGRNGEGGIGLTLNTPDLLSVVDDEYLYDAITEGRPGTAMPAWPQLSAWQTGAIIRYLRSWQLAPRKTLAKMEMSGDYALGEVHYTISCLPCHGEQGRGGVGPQLANAAFLRSVPDEVLYHWIAKGRTGTAMKGFLAEGQGPTTLRPSHIADVIAYLRHLGTREAPPVLRTGVGDPHVGAELFQGNCASCHGTEGQGASAPQLNNPAFLRIASDGFLAATMVLGRTGTPMRSMIHGQAGIGQISPSNVQDIIAYLRLWDVPTTWRRPRAVAEMSQRAISAGERNFKDYCSGCHGPNGKGVEDGPDYYAPALNNPEFLNAASDGFLLATIARGRSNTPMRPFGKGSGGIASLKETEISDIVSYLRTWQQQHTLQGDQ